MKAMSAEFPFVEELPKREKSRVAKLWDQLKEMAALADEHGAMLPVRFVAPLVSVSRQRVYQLIDAGVFVTFEFNGQTFITENSITAWCQTERKAGRPVKLPENNRDCVKMGVAAYRDEKARRKAKGASK